MEEESSEARTFKRQFAHLSSVIKPELEDIATKLYAQGMISDGTRNKAYSKEGQCDGSVRDFLVDVECKIRTNPTYFHEFVGVLEKMKSLEDLASRLKEDHRRLSTPTTADEKVTALHRTSHGTGFSERRDSSCIEDVSAKNRSPTAFVDTEPETRRKSLSRNQKQFEHDCDVTGDQPPERMPVAETSGYHRSSLQLVSGLQDRLKGVEEYVADHYVGRSEAESHVQQIEALNTQLREMKLELDKKNKEVLNLKAEMKEYKDDQQYLVRRCRTLEAELDVLKVRVLTLEEHEHNTNTTLNPQ